MTVRLEGAIGATRIDESVVYGRIAAVWADGPGSATLVRLLAVGSGRPDIAVTGASETMMRAVAVFVGREVRGAAHRHYRPAAGSGR